MSGSRVCFHLADTGSLPASKVLGKLNSNLVPANSIILIGFLACLYSLIGQFNLLTDLAVFSCWIFYTLTFACVIKLRKTQPDAERKYKVPCYPLIPILAIASGLYVVVSQLFLSDMRATIMSVASIAITLVGLPVFLAVKKKNAK
jgi:APA family basic amino acid/polyamine antiporter